MTDSNSDFCCDKAYACARQAYREDPEAFDLDPENPYVGPQDVEPVGLKDFVPLLVGICLIILIFAALLLL